MTIGKRLISVRKALDISQADIAMIMGCNQSNISYYEKDSIQMSVRYLIPLRNAYNVNIDWLLTGEGTMFSAPTPYRNIDNTSSGDFQSPPPTSNSDFQSPPPTSSGDFQSPPHPSSGDFQSPPPTSSGDFQSPPSTSIGTALTTTQTIDALKKENSHLHNELLQAYKKITDLQDKIITLTTAKE